MLQHVFSHKTRRILVAGCADTVAAASRQQRQQQQQQQQQRQQRGMHYDVVIAGGGVMGSSTAYFLKQKSPQLRVCVVERDLTYKTSASALSVASIRQQFSTVENIALSQWSWDFMNNIGEHLAVDGADPPDVQMWRGAYMFLATQRGYEILESNCAIQTSCGADVRFLTPQQLKDIYDWVHVDDLAAASTCFDRKEGWFDGWSLLTAFQKKAVSLGVEYINGTCGVVDIASTVRGVNVDIADNNNNKYIECSHFVNAAGPWAGLLMERIGIRLPVYPRKRYVYVFDCLKGPGREMPLTVDPSGVYCRPEGHGTLFLCGRSPEEHEEPDISNLDVDYEYFEDTIWPHLAARYRGMEELKVKHAWAGFYDYNTFDQNGIIGRHPDVDNLYFVNGFSGHGIQQSPAAGNAVAELIVDGSFVDIDLARFGYERLVSGRELKEVNVI